MEKTKKLNRNEILVALARYYDRVYDGSPTPLWVDEYEDRLAKMAEITNPEDAYNYSQQEICKQIYNDSR